MTAWWDTISSLAKVVVDVSRTPYKLGSYEFLERKGGPMDDIISRSNLPLIEEMTKAASLSIRVYDYQSLLENLSLEIESEFLHDEPICISYFNKIEKSIWVICRGTQSAFEACMDYSWLLSTSTIDGTTIEVPRLVSLISQRVMNKLPCLIEDLIKRHGDIKKIIFTGHSLGGAIASALYVSYKSNTKISSKTPSTVFTFGSPLTFLTIPPTDLISDNDVHNVIYQLDVIPRILGNHEIPPTLIDSDWGKNFIGFINSHDIKRSDYKCWGKYYCLQPEVSQLRKSSLSISIDPYSLISVFPEHVHSLLYAIAHDHSCHLYLETLEGCLEECLGK